MSSAVAAGGGADGGAGQSGQSGGSSGGMAGTLAVIQSVEVVASSWESMNFDEKRREWESSALEVTAAQEAAKTARKKLAENTKAFKKLPDNEKLGNVGPLFKSYQEEIDKLTKRCKKSETEWIGILDHLHNVVEPHGALKSASTTLKAYRDLQAKHAKLTEELEEYKDEFQSLKNQEITVQRLEKQVQDSESAIATRLVEEVSKKRQEWDEEHQSVMREMEEREANLYKQLQESKDKLTSIALTRDNTQDELFQVRSAFEEEVAAKQKELEMLGSDLDSVSASLSIAERERDSLQDEVARLQREIATAPQQDTGGAKISQLTQELSTKEAMVDELQGRLTELVANQTKLSEQHTKEVAEVERRLMSDVERLQYEVSTLSERPTVEEYNRLQVQLKNLQAVAYNSVEVGDSVEELETMLLTKNKHLHGELTNLKNQISTKDQEISELASQTESLRETLADKETLISRLEDDLSNLRTNRTAENSLQTLLQSNSQTCTTPRATPAQEEDAAGGVLHIVVGQRDRYKKKIQEMEDELRNMQQKVLASESEAANLRNDNVKLYEKIRFLQSYKDQDGRRGTPRGMDVENGVESKYSSLYEETLNPFARFHKEERQRHYQTMNTAERITYQGSRLLLGNKFTRTFLFVYSILLHLLVFFTMYHFTHHADTSSHSDHHGLPDRG